MLDNARRFSHNQPMATERKNKINAGHRLHPDVVNEAKRRAEQSGQSETWWIENTLAVAWGLREWPKPPKGIKKAKEIAK